MKEWVKVQRNPTTGATIVTVTVMEENLVAKYAEKCPWTHIKAGVKSARGRAIEMLDQMRAAMAEIEETS